MKRIFIFISSFLFFNSAYSQAKNFSVGILAGPPIRINSVTWLMDDEAVLPAGEEKHHSVTYGAWCAYAPVLLNKRGINKNTIEFKWAITDRLYDFKATIESPYFDKIHTYKHSYHYKQQNYTLNLGYKHYEMIGKLALHAGADFSYIHFQAVKQSMDYDYWEGEKWMGQGRTYADIPGANSLGIFAHTGIAFYPVQALSIGCQLNFGFFRTKVEGRQSNSNHSTYWDGWNWVTQNMDMNFPISRTLYTTTPVIPEIRVGYHFGFKKYLCKESPAPAESQ